ncbi:deoxyguanosinetriphosphate triphosphohydrolase, putative [Fodinibius roseus]|uniref:Deoxyguanosinetriphosphate triphosphohydrolase, putative n=1 Tax=Fodinibius roseus TaxID=1194090 RepID=A0A1M5AA94_9BACT|nr:dNTP triphosphohydrolase [Fodinibius roseus]SHF27189.1 deoxyguanosinetriphosphate triphosphohydrolase, putative [Fodinibius roseus]
MDWKKLLSEERLRPSTRDSRFEGDKRNEFESDYGRIAFSPAIRRMHDKTQVFPLTTDDNIHTRLTHSIEVQSVAKSIGFDICSRDKFLNHVEGDLEGNLKKEQTLKEYLIRRIPTILASTAFCHDIGNPPFGHYGEDIIQNYYKELFSKEEYKEIDLTKEQKEEFINFDGNAQGFRVLTKLQILSDRFGLNLTAGTLASFLKYPCTSREYNSEEKGDYSNKIGVFESEKEHLDKVREKTGLEKERHPLAFLMEVSASPFFGPLKSRGFRLR